MAFEDPRIQTMNPRDYNVEMRGGLTSNLQECIRFKATQAFCDHGQALQFLEHRREEPWSLIWNLDPKGRLNISNLWLNISQSVFLLMESLGKRFCFGKQVENE